MDDGGAQQTLCQWRRQCPAGDSGFRHVSALAACLWGFRSTVSSDTLRRRWRCPRHHGIWQPRSRSGSTLHGGPGRSERLSVVVLPERPPSVHRAHPCPTRTSPRPDVSCSHACCRFTGNCSLDDFIRNALSRNFSLGKSVRPAEHDAEEWWHADDGHRHHRCNEPGIAGLRIPPA